MAFVVPTKRGEFEVRESRSTPKGPRSRTLATFRELDDEVIERARERAAKPPSAKDLRRAALRAGATIAPGPADRAARELIAELGRGKQLNPIIRHMLLGLLGRDGGNGAPPATAGEAAGGLAEWMASTPRERGETLIDLLLLADALPHAGRRGKPLGFPRLDSTGHG
jgi:hypothetical protein